MNLPVSFFLNKEQHSLYESCSDNFQKDFEPLFSTFNEEKIVLGKRILSCISSCNEEQRRIAALCFSTLLHFRKPIDLLVDKIYSLCKAGKNENFFNFIYRCKKEKDSRSIFMGNILFFEQNSNEISREGFLHISIDKAFIPLPYSIRYTFDKCTSLSESIEKAFNYLNSLTDDERLPIENYHAFFDRLEKEKNILFQSRPAIGLLELVLLTTTKKEVCHLRSITYSDLEKILYAFENIYEKYGIENLALICLAKGYTDDLDIYSLLRLFSFFQSIEYEYIAKELEGFNYGSIKTAKLFEKLETIAANIDVPSTNNHVDALFEKFLKEKNPLTQKELNFLKPAYQEIEKLCEKYKKLNLDQLRKRVEDIQKGLKETPSSKQTTVELIALARIALYLKFGIYPYSTQILTVLILLFSQEKIVGQMKTGEGKSTIFALLSFVLTIQGRSVDIISSSPSLSIRDEKKYRDFFKTFNITTSHICEDRQTVELFKAHILFGTASHFEFAVMRDMVDQALFFETRKNFTKAKSSFDVVLVDEVDNLTIDTLMNSSRIAYPSKNAIDWVYLPLKAYFDGLDPFFINLNEIHSTLEKHKKGLFLEETKKITDDQLIKWADVYQKACQLKENRNYIVKETIDPFFGKERKILITDLENTGKILEGCRWSDGLHEFIECRHGIPVEKESVVPISLSHAVYYDLYTFIYGLTGTLGFQKEREELKNIYKIHSFDVPLHKPSQREDMALRLFNSNKEWQEAIMERVRMFKEKGRPLLLICKTIEESENFASLFKSKAISFELFNGKQTDEEKILASAGLYSAITIATNTAGRGTDIVLDMQSLESGGLHVLITFYPESERVEEQARGRAGRQGQKGSSEIMISKEMYGNMISLQLIRYIKESQLSALHQKKAHFERYCYQFTKIFFSKITAFRELFKKDGYSLESAAKLFEKHISMKQNTESRFLRILGSNNNTKEKKRLLIDLRDALEKKVIFIWSTIFFQKLSGIDLNNNLSLEEIEKKILLFYEEQKESWEKYLSPDCKGLDLYIEELINQEYLAH